MSALTACWAAAHGCHHERMAQGLPDVERSHAGTPDYVLEGRLWIWFSSGSIRLRRDPCEAQFDGGRRHTSFTGGFRIMDSIREPGGLKRLAGVPGGTQHPGFLGNSGNGHDLYLPADGLAPPATRFSSWRSPGRSHHVGGSPGSAWTISPPMTCGISRGCPYFSARLTCIIEERCCPR